jgi:type I restriction enzyme R subunit
LEKYSAWKGFNSEAQKVVLQDYHDDGSGKSPRYYQTAAANAAVEAIAKGQNRVLLVMATGTGKTYTAFQIIWRLWKGKQKKRVLFLADRNILVDQTMVNDFRPFGSTMAKLTPKSAVVEREDGSSVTLETALDRQRRLDPSYEIYLGLYQALTGPEERQKLFKEFSRDFFDLIIIDECHRGSAEEESAWREILEYFGEATQVGMTATPKETKYASSTHYFGKPVYTYSLKQGIEDGFLAPYKVVKVHLDKDVEGYRPHIGDRDRDGAPIEDRQYNQKDFDVHIVIDERTKMVAKKITQYLKESGDPYQKSIVFCVDEEHAERMRQAIANENKEECLQDSRYVMRITGSDSEGKSQLGNFIDPESRYPVIATTSKLLSTGVDVQTCRLIVLDREVGSMTEFKQIIGRGTRVHEDTKKYFFTIIDFRKATNNFAEPEFDGDPVSIYSPTETGPICPPDDVDPTNPEVVDGGDETIIVDGTGEMPTSPVKRNKIYVDGVSVTILAERVEYLDANGKLITESLKDFSKKALGKHFSSLDQFIKKWNSADRKKAIVEELETEGLLLEAIANDLGKDIDPFDLILYLAFDVPTKTRKQRADSVRNSNIFEKYGPNARKVIEALLLKYQDDGETDVLNFRILTLPPINRLGTPLEIVNWFGSQSEYQNAMKQMQNTIYAEAN